MDQRFGFAISFVKTTRLENRYRVDFCPQCVCRSGSKGLSINYVDVVNGQPLIESFIALYIPFQIPNSFGPKTTFYPIPPKLFLPNDDQPRPRNNDLYYDEDERNEEKRRTTEDAAAETERKRWMTTYRCNSLAILDQWKTQNLQVSQRTPSKATVRRHTSTVYYRYRYDPLLSLFHKGGSRRFVVTH